MKERTEEDLNFEKADPNPEYLITSIAEQGYSLETALADLIDNSISAKADKIEILTDVSVSDHLSLYITDNGNGMTSEELTMNLKFPSSSISKSRDKSDLGRFGLGMKTASFSQTRKFTVISRIQNGEYAARTWDVEYLKSTGEWRIIVNSSDEIDAILINYRKCSADYGNQFVNFEPNTLVVWQGLYKFENYISHNNRASALIKQLKNTTREYLGIVFHRYMQKKEKPLLIRVNHWMVEYFDPFPVEKRRDLRSAGSFECLYKGDLFKAQAFVLPAVAIKEEKKHGGWVTPNRNLMDLEGMYIYRGERIIYFGGWNGLMKREANLKLARLRVDVGNINDDIFQLNVAKSKISIPFELQRGFLEKLTMLRDEAKKEYFNHGIRDVSSTKNEAKESVFNKIITSKHGAVLELNTEYPGIKSFLENLTPEQNKQFKIILHLINVSSNKLLDKHEDKEITGVVERDKIEINILVNYVGQLKSAGFDKEQIMELALKDLGFKENNLPLELTEILKKL
jgi:hypothetical protein